MGLHMTCIYSNFSTDNVEKFEKRMINWCNEACTAGISRLIFDQEMLNVKGTLEIWYDECLPYHRLTLPRITLAYTQIQGTNMCIMYKIWENSTQKVIYKMPSKWDGTELWLGK